MSIGIPAGYKFRSDAFLRQQAIAKAEMVLKALKARGFSVSEDIRERVMSCKDEEQLETWLARAMTAESIDEVFQVS